MKIIFDTDPGVDDSMAILFAHLCPEIDLIGLTSVFGNASIAQTTRNAVYLRDRFGLDCAVHQGAGQPLSMPLDEPPAFVHGDDGLGNTGFSTDQGPDEGDAVSFIIETVRANPGEITLVPVGRMTNIALALALAPDIADLVRGVVLMGGVIGRNGIIGNVTPVAEANIYGDPHAADVMMQASWPLTMVGLDVTMQTLVAPERMQRLADEGGELGEFLFAISRHYQAFYQSRSGSESFPMHDSLALIYAIRPDLFGVEQGALRVLTEGDGLGQTVFSPANRVFHEAPWTQERPHQNVCVSVDSAAVLDLYFDTFLKNA